MFCLLSKAAHFSKEVVSNFLANKAIITKFYMSIDMNLLIKGWCVDYIMDTLFTCAKPYELMLYGIDKQVIEQELHEEI